MSAGMVLAVPIDGSLEAFVEGHFGLEAEELFGTRYVEPAAWLAVGFGGIPADLAFEADELYNFFDEVFDCDFESCADIDGLCAIVAFGGEKYAFGGVTCINKLP